MKIVAFVPLKLNNERLPGKNIKQLTNGRPLVSYILNTLDRVESVDERYVYCSDELICNYIESERIKYLGRDKSLDQSSTKINEVLKAFASDVYADIYVLVHATSPFISTKSIDYGIRSVRYNGHDSALSVYRLQEFIWHKNQPMNYDLENVPRTQDLSPLFVETTGLYIYQRSLIVERNRRIGDNPFLIEVSQIEALDVNNPIDFEIVDAVLEHGLVEND